MLMNALTINVQFIVFNYSCTLLVDIKLYKYLFIFFCYFSRYTTNSVFCIAMFYNFYTKCNKLNIQ